MKLILSRKGFDAGAGHAASAILPSGDLCWLPIPSTEPPIRYRDIRFGGYTLGEHVEDLTRNRITSADYAHLDPDINATSLERMNGWRPLFGQTGSAQGHLTKLGVGKGDVFLFYAWFRRAEFRNATWAYLTGAPDLHVIFGWLQVDEVWSSNQRGHIPAWAAYHPHLCGQCSYDNDTVYVAADSLELPDCQMTVPGAGVFRRFHPSLRLTAENSPRSLWKLPRWFYPEQRPSSLSYHRAMNRWNCTDDSALLRCVARGQEFVLDCDHYPESLPWLQGLMNECSDSYAAQ